MTDELLPNPRLPGKVEAPPTEMGEPGLGEGGRETDSFQTSFHCFYDRPCPVVAPSTLSKTRLTYFCWRRFYFARKSGLREKLIRHVIVLKIQQWLKWLRFSFWSS